MKRSIEINKKLASDLLDGVPEDQEADHQVIADAILNGDSKDDILAMDETMAYEGTYQWIEDNLEA